MKKTNLGFLLSIAVLSEFLLQNLLSISLTSANALFFLQTMWLFAGVWSIQIFKDVLLVRGFAEEMQSHLIKKDSAHVLSFAVIMSIFVSLFHLSLGFSFEKIFLYSLISVAFSVLLLEVFRNYLNDFKNHMHKLFRAKNNFMEVVENG